MLSSHLFSNDWSTFWKVIQEPEFSWNIGAKNCQWWPHHTAKIFNVIALLNFPPMFEFLNSHQIYFTEGGIFYYIEWSKWCHKTINRHFLRTPLHCAADVGNLEIWHAYWKRKCKTNSWSATQNQINSQLIKEGLMIRSSVPEEPTGETDCSTYVLSQDNK